MTRRRAVSTDGARRKYESPRQLARQSRILACAREMLSELGYAGMTMRALAGEADVSAATLYNLYNSKDDLILAACQDLLDDLAQRTALQIEREGIDAILVISRESSRQIVATPEYADAMTRGLFNVAKDHRLVEVLYRAAVPTYAHHLNMAREQSQLAHGTDVDQLARQLVGQDWGIVMNWMMGLVSTAELEAARARGLLMLLVGTTRGTVRRRLEQALQQLDR